MKSKSQSLRIRRREIIKISEEINSSCSDLEEQLQQAEYIGTQLEGVDIEELVEEQGSKKANVFEEVVHIKLEVTAKKRGRPKK